jgi:hypothetical protein
MRWSPDQLAKGVNKGKSLADAIKENMLVKLDFVMSIGVAFYEVSEIYITKYQTNKKKNDVENNIEHDISEYTKEGNYMKALKRLFSLINLTKGNKNTKKILIQFFNSQIGLVNKCANDLELLQQIKPHITKKQYIDNSQMIKERLGTLDWVNNLKYIDELKIDAMVKYLRQLISLDCKNLLHRLV